MSLKRAANSTPRHAGGGVQWAGNTPWRPAPVAPREPAQEPPVAAAVLPRRQAGDASGGRRLCQALG